MVEKDVREQVKVLLDAHWNNAEKIYKECKPFLEILKTKAKNDSALEGNIQNAENLFSLYKKLRIVIIKLRKKFYTQSIAAANKYWKKTVNSIYAVFNDTVKKYYRLCGNLKEEKELLIKFGKIDKEISKEQMIILNPERVIKLL